MVRYTSSLNDHVGFAGSSGLLRSRGQGNVKERGIRDEQAAHGSALN